MKKITKVIVDRNLCIGAGTCVTTAGEVFKLDEENKAVVVNIKGADISDLLIAAHHAPRPPFLYMMRMEIRYFQV